MDDLGNLKYIINEQLNELKVTDELERKTLNKIFNRESNFWALLRKNWMQMTTVFSLFVIICTLGINTMLHKNKATIITPERMPNVTQFRLSNDYSIEEYEEETTEKK